MKNKDKVEKERIIDEAVGEKSIGKLEFRGGVFTATVPLVFFICGLFLLVWPS